MHILKVKELLDNGHLEEAHEALENLLELGPNNMEGLKLKAFLYESKGKFQEEIQVWQKIFEIDNEDEDAIEFIQKKQIEDREHYYFTDDLPEGGRRFLAYPKTLIKISLVGLVGCILFLLTTRLADIYSIPHSGYIIAAFFLLLVISPWVGIIYTYTKSIHAIEVKMSGIEVATRFKSFAFGWDELEKISLAYSSDPNTPNLRLIIIPLDTKRQPIEIDLNEDTSAIKARTYLANEIRIFYQELSHDPYESLSLAERNPIVF